MFGIKLKRRPGRITELDVLLADGLRMHEDSLCPDCHQPIQWAWDVHNARYFGLDSEPPQCQACQVLEVAAKDTTTAHEPGTKRRLLNLMPILQGGDDRG